MNTRQQLPGSAKLLLILATVIFVALILFWLGFVLLGTGSGSGDESPIQAQTVPLKPHK